MKKVVKELKDEYILLTIDPSLKCTGWSIVKIQNKEPYNWYNKNLQLIDYGIIPTHNQSHSKSLITFEKILLDVINKYNPDYVTSEQMFSGANRQTGISLGHIHGVMQLVCAKNNLEIVYYSVMTAKSITLGGVKTKKEDGTKKTGDELKMEVESKVLEILGKESFYKEYTLDVTDAISMGFTFIALKGKTIKEIEKEKKLEKKNKNKLKEPKKKNKL